MSADARLATCACTRLAVRCVGEPALVSLCHCLECQKRTGSAFGIAAFFDRNAVTIEGDARRYSRSSDGGFEVEFSFCPTCGTTVFWKPERRRDLIAVAVGCFADPAFPAPTKAVFAEHRHSWLPLHIA